MGGGSVLWGASAAISWGFADFIARFTGRSVGVAATFLFVSVVGLGALLLFMWLRGDAMLWHSPDALRLSGLGLLVAAGVASALATILLYEALAKGPVSLASPVVSSYPAFAVPISIALGARPNGWHWLAMAVTMVGIWLVAYSVSSADSWRSQYDRAVIRRSILLSLAGALCFALALISAGLAIEIYGPWQTMIAVRIIGGILFVLWFLLRRELPRFHPRLWPMLIALSLLDTMGYLGVYLGLGYVNGEFAIVASSAYAVVTVVLARIFLREPVGFLQWGGVALVVCGIALLAAVE
ncbi:MAG: DMT family transporter [Rhodospirillaceae bacterium]|nr:DMT family transporter [Rhodospirillaceae bacterium]MBT5037445.1 DMT family transporter [Rhodospirillaceae bacterium]